MSLVSKRTAEEAFESNEEDEDEPQPAVEAFEEEEDFFQSQGEGDAFCLEALREALREALPWAEYPGMPQEQFAAATQQTGGIPLFHFEFSPVSEQQ